MPRTSHRAQQRCPIDRGSTRSPGSSRSQRLAGRSSSLLIPGDCADLVPRLRSNGVIRSRVHSMVCPGLVIFDCDGVLVDSELIDMRIRSERLRAAGFPITAQVLADARSSGTSLTATIEERFGRSLPTGFMEATRAEIMRTFTDELRAIDGVGDLLRALDIPTCVASNSHPDRVRHSLEVTALWQFFDPHVFSAAMVPQGKPAPDLFLLAAERLNVPPALCLVVEDSTHGVIAAWAAGMEVVGFCGGSHCREGHADRLLRAGSGRVFSGMADLSEFLARLEPPRRAGGDRP
jgi:HAD superfamily hydrolase (TIGR01509 family)